MDEAIQLAIAGHWEEAVDLNRTILERFGQDEDTNNRLGKALTELGRLEDAKAAYEVSLGINPMNPIARKNITKLESLLQAPDSLKAGPAKVDLNLFVEEMGKTVVTMLEDVNPDVAAKVAAGDVADIRPEGDGIVAETVRGVRLGVLEPKLARRLIKFIQGGNRYQAGVTSVEGGQVKVIIRETYQDPRYAGKPSFPMRRQRAADFRPYTKESLIPRDIEIFGDEDEDEERLAPASEMTDDYEGLSVEDDTEDVDFAEPEEAEADSDSDDEDEDE